MTSSVTSDAKNPTADEKRRAQRKHADDLRGAGRLAIEATKGVAAVVESMQRTIASGPDILGRPLEVPARVLTGLVYGAVRGVTAAVGAGIDRGIAELAPLLGASTPGPEREAALAILNGVLGDHLAETRNPLAIEMRLRQRGLPLAAPLACTKLLVLVHGSCMNDLQWRRGGHDHGAALARDLEATAVYVHYNSGLHISTNGRALALLLEEETGAVDEIVIVAHSMGGLVARSACHYGRDMAWRTKLQTLVTLGTPHHGSPLERAGNAVDVLLARSRYSAPLARLSQIRSAGVTDMRYGSVVDDDWRGSDRFVRQPDRRARITLPADVACYAVAGTHSKNGDDLAALAVDGQVPVRSALGLHHDASRTLRFRDTLVAYGVGHIHLLSSPAVYTRLLSWCREGARRAVTSSDARAPR